MQNKVLKQFSMVEKVLLGAAWVLGTMLLAQGLLSIYFYGFYQRHPITYTNLPAKVSPVVVRAGQAVFALTSRCSLDNYEYTTTRSLSNDIVYGLPGTTGTIPKGCTTINRLILIVPGELPAGKYFASTTVHITVKWLWFHRQQTYLITSQTFTIK